MSGEQSKEFKPWDIVRLEGHTDIYRVYRYRGGFIFCGLNSDTVRDSHDQSVRVTKIVVTG